MAETIYDIYNTNSNSKGADIYSTEGLLDTDTLRLPPEIIAERAAKANFALKEDSPGIGELFNTLSRGGEPEVRKRIADKENIQHENIRLKLLQDVATKLPKDVNPYVLNYLMGAAAKGEQDPNFAIEAVFARHWINEAVAHSKDNNKVFGRAFETATKEYLDLHKTSQDVLARQQAFQTLNEDLRTRYEQLPNVALPNKNSKLYSYVRNFSDVVNWYDISNVVPGGPNKAATPGGQIEEQARYLWTAPVDKIPNAVKAIKELFNSNPHAALELSDALLRYSSDDTFIKNLLVGANLGLSTTVTGIGKLAGGTLRRLEKGFAIEAAGGARKVTPEAVAATTPTRSPDSGGIKLLTDQRPKPSGLITDQRPGSDAYTKQGELFPTDSSIYTRQGELDLKPPPFAAEQTVGLPLELEYTPIRDPKTRALRFETYGEGEGTYQLGHSRLKKGLPRDDLGRFVKVPKEQLKLDVDTPQIPSQIEAPLVGGKGTKPTPTVAADKVDPTKSFTREDYLAAAASFARGPRELNEARNAFVATIQAAATNKIDPQVALSKIGDIGNAAVVGAAKEIKAKLEQIDPEGVLQPLVVNAPHLMNPNIYAKAVDSVSGVAASRLANKAINRVIEGLSKLSEPTRVSRLTEESLQQAIDTTRAFDMKYFRDTNHALVNAYADFTVVSPSENRLTNTGLIKYWFGRPDATAFNSAEEAATTALDGYKLPEGGFTVRQQGTGYYVVITKPVRETTAEVKNHFIETLASKIPDSWSNFLFRWGKTADSLTSLHDSRARKVAVSAPSGLKAFEQQALNEISKLGKEQRSELQKVMEYDRIWEDPVTGRIGTYQRTVEDFEKLFIELNGKLPTEAQKEAYHTTVFLNDFDYVKRSLDWLRDLHRQGAELVRFYLPSNVSTATSADAKPTEWFMGRRVEDIPWDARGDAVIWYWDTATNASKVFHKLDKTDDIMVIKGYLRGKVKDGELQVIEVGNPKALPLKESLELHAPVNYILTNTAQFKPLKATDIAEYRPGGHIVYANRYYLKQPTIEPGYKGRLYYYGDKTILGVETEKEAILLEKYWTEAQKLLKQGKDRELETYLATHLPDMPLNKFKQYFTGAGPGGGLSVDTPIKWVEQNKDVFDVHPQLKDLYPEVKELLSAPDMMTYLDKRFIADRGQILNVARKEGTESNPMFRISAPNLINPYVAMTRAMGNSTKGRWMGDYKHLAAEHWIEQYKDVLKVDLAELRANPLYYLTRANEHYNYNVDRSTLAAAESARQRVNTFIGYDSGFSRDAHYVMHKIQEAVGNTMGKEWQDYVRDHIMERIKDPATHMRAFAFHLNLGMFNPVTYFTQLQTLINVMAIAPTHALQANAATFLQRGMLRTEDPKIWAHYAKTASKLGWDKDQFLESFAAMKRTNWHMVGGEVAFKDSVVELTPFKSKIGTFLAKGTMFFNEGERVVRMTAWNAAYREWRKANPTKVMNAIDESAILQRADDMGVNMTRASNAQWNTGIMSIPTQYFSYQARLMEQIHDGILQTGAKKLSRAETARLLAATSIMYGIPVGLGAIAGFYPVYDDIKKAAIERNINIHDNWFKAAQDGLVSFIVSQLTGKDYNFAQRYGPGGNDSIVQILKGNKKWYEVLGAAPSTIASVIGSIYPILKASYSTITGDGSFPHTIEDFIEASKEVKGANSIVKAIYMFNTHNYVTKNQTLVNSVDNLDAIAMGLFGLTPRSITDTFSALQNEKDIKSGKEWFEQKIITEYRLAMKAYSNGDNTAGDGHLKRVGVWAETGGLTWNDRIKVFNRALDQNENLYEMAERMRQMRQATTPKGLK